MDGGPPQPTARMSLVSSEGNERSRGKLPFWPPHSRQWPADVSDADKKISELDYKSDPHAPPLPTGKKPSLSELMKLVTLGQDYNTYSHEATTNTGNYTFQSSCSSPMCHDVDIVDNVGVVNCC